MIARVVACAALARAIAGPAAFAQLRRDAPGAMQPRAPTTAVPSCRTDRLTLQRHDDDGAYNGMSHSGTRLVLRNEGALPCAVPAFPMLTLLDSAGVIAATPRTPAGRFMHPGPYVPPVVIPAGAAVTDTLRWVSGVVYDRSVCRRPTTLALAVGGAALRVGFAGQLCGDRAAGGIAYTMTRFVVDTSAPAPDSGPNALPEVAPRQARERDPCPGRTTQADLNQCASRRAARADSVLERTYAALLARVGVERRPALVTAQVAWAQYRDADCRYRASAVAGGSMQPMVLGFCREEAAQARAHQLARDIWAEHR